MNHLNQIRRHNRGRRRNRDRRAFWFVPTAIIGIFAFGYVFMLLWNALMPEIFGLKIIGYWQAVGLLVLSKIIFSGVRHDHCHHKFHDHRNELNFGWENLSPEEKEKLKNEFIERFDSRFK